MAAAKFKPPRLVALIDYNKVQLDGPSDIIMPMDPLPEKLRAFNWNVAPVVYDGHNAAEVLESLDWAKCQTQFPAAVIYKTHKGRGVSFMEDNAHWHGAVIDDQTYAKARTELLDTLGDWGWRYDGDSVAHARRLRGGAARPGNGSTPRWWSWMRMWRPARAPRRSGKNIRTGSLTSAWRKPTWWTSRRAWQPAACGPSSAHLPSS